MRGGLAEVPAAECRRTAGSRHSAAGGQAEDFGVGRPPAPDESKAEHIQAETATRGFAGRHAEGTRPPYCFHNERRTGNREIILR